MLIELLRPAGPDMARRWLAALLMVDASDRAQLVAEVERRVAATYGRQRPGLGSSAAEAVREVKITHPPVQREGYVEQTTVIYADPEKGGPARKPRRSRRNAAM